MLTLDGVARDLPRRLTAHLSPRSQDGRRGPSGATTSTSKPIRTGTNCMMFSEYFNGDTGAGVGASHQTGWTALVVSLLYRILGMPWAATNSPPAVPIPAGQPSPTEGVNFCVYAKHAFRGRAAAVRSFGGCLAAPRRSPLEPDRTHDYWHVFVRGIGPGQLYGYRVPAHRAGRGCDSIPRSCSSIRTRSRSPTLRITTARERLPPATTRRRAMKSVVIDPRTYDWEGDPTAAAAVHRLGDLRDARRRLHANIPTPASPRASAALTPASSRRSRTWSISASRRLS